MSKLRFEIVHFLVILVLILLNVGGCGGQPLNLKSIPKVKIQMPLPSEHTQAPILTQWTVFVGHLGFQSITNQYKRPCIWESSKLGRVQNSGEFKTWESDHI